MTMSINALHPQQHRFTQLNAVTSAPRFGNEAQTQVPQESVLMPKLNELHKRLWDGAKRVFRMMLFRPKGWAEMVLLHPWTLGISAVLICGKHFLEGFLHVDSLYKTRMISMFSSWSKDREFGRTLKEAWQENKPEAGVACSHPGCQPENCAHS
jgi:hypothetical protein